MNINDKMRVIGRLHVDKYSESGEKIGEAHAENMFLTVGINEIWKLVTGKSSSVFDSSMAMIGIGDSELQSNANQSDLMAGENKSYRPMDVGYPSEPANGSVVFKATFGSNDGNHTWNEFVIKNSETGICIDRGVQPMGSKVAGTIWVATVTLSIA